MQQLVIFDIYRQNRFDVLLNFVYGKLKKFRTCLFEKNRVNLFQLILKEEELKKCQNELQELQKNNKEVTALEEKVKSLQSEK